MLAGRSVILRALGDSRGMAVWRPGRPRLRPWRLAAAWLASALALLLAAGLVPGAEIRDFAGAVLVAAIVGVLNAVLPPLIAALRLLAADIAPDVLHVGGFGSALAVALIASAVSTGIGVVAGIDEDDAY